MLKVTSILFALVLYTAVLFKVRADCDAELQFQDCLQHNSLKKSTECSSALDYDCICLWSNELASCYNQCVDDPDKADERKAAFEAAKNDCANALKYKKTSSTTSSSSTSSASETNTYSKLARETENASSRDGKAANKAGYPVENSAGINKGSLFAGSVVAYLLIQTLF
ncbi:hypothetical protein AX774_g3188 [Zancudomyces culisetae]|uniref:Extracellular membrane protein CFEM domain-containing protein n=1 Tax=Zancudomyces culisetae TaxID=1213189 RepID=A0A1R1PQR7_ZANCU|nr:hypothetical protein AX774_g4417 [Zancudomyces culisetae]OMH83307.1 hypothetical protein AX774_g3188 [Zancudomyces culisetae]|eukprot:OMH82120.1 hypothetical protein AX774_g4417 [Zancudomyces culisetae]